MLCLYLEDVEKMEYAAENADPLLDDGAAHTDQSADNAVAVVMFNPATPQNVWRLTDELLMYPEVYYMNEENLDKITDSRVTSADKVILYAADDDLQQEAFDNLLSSTGLKTMTYRFGEDMWKTYEVR